jgi:hypothetical protein
MAVKSSEIVNLEKLYNFFKGKLPNLEEEIEHLINAADDNVILLYSRRCLEIIVTDLCERELKRPRKTEPLQGIIDKLNREEKVPSHIITSMLNLNSLSVYGVHPKEYDPQQVRAVLINLVTVITWYLKYRSIEIVIDSESIKRVMGKNEPVGKQKKSSVKVLPWALPGIITVLFIAVWIFFKRDPSNPLPVQRFTVNLPSDETFGGQDMGSSVTISPDGSKIIFVSLRNDTSFLFLRRIDEFEASLIPGTVGAAAPFFSPDNRWVCFFANGNLKKLLLPGGRPMTICEAKSGRQGCWGMDNNIVFADAYKACLMQVPATGGTPEQLTTGLKYSIEEEVHSHYWPQVLPGNKAILFTAYLNKENARIVAYSNKTGESWNLIEPGNYAKYVQTGHLVYAWQGDLLGVPFHLM